MTDHIEIRRHVLEVLIRSPGCGLDELVFECEGLTWNQVFLAIDRLSREDALKLKLKGRGLYKVHLSDHTQHEASQHVNV